MLDTKCKMALVYWTDAAMSTQPHWNNGALPDPPSNKIHNLCATLGWLAYMDKDWVQIVTTLTDGAHGHVTEIPRGMIHAIEVLKVSEVGDATRSKKRRAKALSKV
jgi:hypothetical protein